MPYYKTRKIIEKADYDSEVKAEFLKRLTKDFFDTHESFLSTPLLAIMLMLTFADFAEIPTSLHVFYCNAFDMLVRRHDALKSQFLRTMHSGCSAEQFRRLFASFCVITYSKSKFQFTHDEAVEFVGHALKQQNIQADPAHVLTDLSESICLLQIEGFEISFVHRSFQEYFCALFVSLAPSGAVALYLNSGRYRTYDSVLPMLYAMVPERVEAEWALPTLRRLVDLIGDSRDPGRTLLTSINKEIGFVFLRGTHIVLHFQDTGLSRALSALHRFYPAHFRSATSSSEEEISEEDAEIHRKAQLQRILALEASGDVRFAGLAADLAASKARGRGERLLQRKVPLKDDDDDS